MKIAVVTFADDKVERYELGVIRLKHSVQAMMSEADFICFRTFEEIGSPTHKEVPYAFKAYAIEKARQMGYDLVLWCDSVVYATKSLQEVFNHIEKEGYLFFNNIGYSIGDYTSDDCLNIMGMGREDSFKHPMIMACCMGFDFREFKSLYMFDSYFKHAATGAYNGDWFNNKNQVSSDSRVKGHRHDQSVMSILIAQLGFEILIGHETFFTYANNKAMSPVAESVCLVSK